MEKELEEKRNTIEELENRIKEEEIKTESHWDALERAQAWKEWQKGLLNDEIAEKSKEIQTAYKNLERKDEQIKKLQTELEEKSEELKKITKRFEKLEMAHNETNYLLYLDRKPLPSLPRNKSKFKQLGAKIKTKFNHWIEKRKSQEQNLVARIEVNK